jgi:hypothetical protein
MSGLRALLPTSRPLIGFTILNMRGCIPKLIVLVLSRMFEQPSGSLHASEIAFNLSAVLAWVYL